MDHAIDSNFSMNMIMAMGEMQTSEGFTMGDVTVNLNKDKDEFRLKVARKN